jgi:phosphatidylserine/phosphatidylglycerophosphate/cardiolipin synthase-like enzyme
MASVSSKNKGFSLKAYRGDAKTLLAFNLPKSKSKNLAGFSVHCEPDLQPAYYLHNQLQFKEPARHAQDPKEPPNSSINAPIHKFRWLHVPGSVHQGTKPFFGKYRYTVTPRYFDSEGSLHPIDPGLGASVRIDVAPYQKGALAVGFTRGFTQSQAFVNHFGVKALIRPKDKALIFDTAQSSGVDAQGRTYTYADEYEWLGFTAHERVFALLDEVHKNKQLRLDMFAYDLNEPDLIEAVLALARQGRVRVILDDAALHHNAKSPKPEDQFETLFAKARKGNAAILRGKFGRYAHDKVLIVSRDSDATKVLTGSTNFSVTGLYVNSNHVLVFDDPKVAGAYAGVFEQSWSDGLKKAKFQQSSWATQAVEFKSKTVPPTSITFSPHDAAVAAKILGGIAERIEREGKKSRGSVLFAVMEIDNGTSPVYSALNALHADESIFSFGISDSTKGVRLYKPGRKTGVLVTGKPGKTMLPPPFNQVPNVGLGHQVHHKFVVCGFNRDDAVVYCGSSNLASGGEEANGDNLLAIHDPDVATVFAIEALGLVDHFNFLDRYASGTQGKKKPAASPQYAAAAAGWFLATSDAWTAPYYDPTDLHYVDRLLFG